MVANIVSPRVDTDWAVSSTNFPTNDSIVLNVCYNLLTVLKSFHIPAPANHLSILIFLLAIFRAVCMYLFIYVCMYVCMYVLCMCVCVHCVGLWVFV